MNLEIEKEFAAVRALISSEAASRAAVDDAIAHEIAALREEVKALKPTVYESDVKIHRGIPDDSSSIEVDIDANKIMQGIEFDIGSFAIVKSVDPERETAAELAIKMLPYVTSTDGKLDTFTALAEGILKFLKAGDVPAADGNS